MRFLPFNSKKPSVMHIDLNSCFASIEQQANPYLRGKPIAVAAYTTPRGCIIAPSVEAKRLGIKVGMRVEEGKAIYPNLVVLPPDPWKYRNVHLKLRRLLSEYTPKLVPKSIDEFVLDLEDYWSFKSKVSGIENKMFKLGKEIKLRIKREIGDWLTVSIGVAPNRFLAKLASNLHKPDGLEEINKDNFCGIYSKLSLTDLPYIKFQNSLRLNSVGIFSVLDFYHSPLWKLKAAFESINGYFWYLRLRGYEIDNIEFGRKSFGNSYALPKPLVSLQELSPILCKLTEKSAFRLRKAGYSAKGIHVAIGYKDGTFWHKGVSFLRSFFDSREIYKNALRILAMSPYSKPVRDLSVSVFGLKKKSNLQLELFQDCLKKEKLFEAIDKINNRWGSFVLKPARMLFLKNNEVPDRIAFGGVKELEDFVFSSSVLERSNYSLL